MTSTARRSAWNAARRNGSPLSHHDSSTRSRSPAASDGSRRALPVRAAEPSAESASANARRSAARGARATASSTASGTPSSVADGRPSPPGASVSQIASSVRRRPALSARGGEVAAGSKGA